MVKIITLNANGIRAAQRKDFFTWLHKQQADVVCIQETKAQQWQLDPAIFFPENYHCYYADAKKKGYSGVAVYSRIKPKKITVGLGFPIADDEGRYLQVDFKNISVASIYLPSGTSGDERQQLKYQFLDNYKTILQQQRKQQREYIICGDWNIAHQEIDLKNWRANRNNSGFLPKEREWLTHIFDDIGYIDAFRQINPNPDQYTWWSNRGQAWQNNVGWRIDYQIVTPDLAKKIVQADIYKAQRFSDHSPLIMKYDINIE